MDRSVRHPIRLSHFSGKIGYSRGKLFGILILGALFAFELFNYSTTDYALNDLLGGLRFTGVRWATILALAFCGIDFAGIARLFTPEKGTNEHKEVWYLFGAWLLAASMNAMLTWWGVALAIVGHQSLGGRVIDRETLLTIVPIFVAVMVWLIRVLIIGTFSVAGDRLYSQGVVSPRIRSMPVPGSSGKASISPMAHPVSVRSMPKSSPQPERRPPAHIEPTYHPTGTTGYQQSDNQARQ